MSDRGTRVVCARGALAVAALATLAGCAQDAPRWTPVSVAPPSAKDNGVETPAPIHERAQAVAPAPDAKTPAPLTRDGAILTALLHNRAIGVAQLGPAIGETSIDEARAAFDPSLTALVSTGHIRRQTTTPLASATSATLPIALNEPTLASSQALNVITQLQAAEGLLFPVPPPADFVNTTTGSMQINEFLPTGTSMFLAGSSTTDSPSVNSTSEGTDYVVGITQQLLRGAGPRVNLIALRQARNSAAQTDHQFRNSVLGIVQQTETAYWELALAFEVLNIRRSGVELAESQLKRENDLLSVGKAIQGDVMNSLAERAARQADLADAQAAYRTQTIVLLRLINPDDAPHWETTFDAQDKPEVAELHPDAAASSALALKYRPELAQARLGVTNLDLDVVRAHNGLLPQLQVTGSYGGARAGISAADVSNRVGGNGRDGYTFGVQLQSSLLDRAEKARYRRAKLSSEQGMRSLADLEQSITSEVHQAVIGVDGEWQRLTATAEGVRSRKEALRVTEGRREVGKATNLDVQQSQRDVIQAEVDDATARVRYIEALTKLYAAEGTLLERRGVALADAKPEMLNTLENATDAAK